MTKRRKTIFAFVIILFILIFICGLEIGLQKKHHISPDQPMIFFPTFRSIERQKKILSGYKEIVRPNQYIPYLLWRQKPNLSTSTYSTNNLGYRDGNWSFEKSPSVRRIFLVGGSSAWGYGSSSNLTTISSFLGKILNQSAKTGKYEVLNASENGYTSTQEFILWKDLLPYKPDLIIIYDGYNDLYSGFLGLPPGWNHPFIQEKILTQENLNVISSITQDEISKVISQIEILNIIKNKLGSNNNKTQQFSDVNEVADVYNRNLNLILDISESEKIPVIVVLQPNLYSETKKLSPEESDIIRTQEKLFPGVTSYFQNGTKKMKDYLDTATKVRRFQFIDGNSFFSDLEKNIYFDPVHYSDEGNDIIARKLAEIIISK